MAAMLAAAHSSVPTPPSPAPRRGWLAAVVAIMALAAAGCGQKGPLMLPAAKAPAASASSASAPVRNP